MNGILMAEITVEIDTSLSKGNGLQGTSVSTLESKLVSELPYMSIAVILFLQPTMRHGYTV